MGCLLASMWILFWVFIFNLCSMVRPIKIKIIKFWVPCWECDEEGFVEDECFEDTCCCANPHALRGCTVCHGKGGWWSNKPRLD